EALCQRAIIINEGQIIHDGSLGDIVDRFSTHKIMDLQFSGTDLPPNLDQYGTVVEQRPPRVKIEVPRTDIPRILNQLLSKYNIDDVGVKDRPLEEVIAELFSQYRPRTEHDQTTLSTTPNSSTDKHT
ncbi:MAG: ABC transporter, partial [Planctomycetaceae bacterium]